METKTKLTLLVRKSTISRGKEYATRHGTTLSRVFEEAVEKAVQAEEPLWADKWLGKLKKAHRPDDPRMRALERKFG